MNLKIYDNLCESNNQVMGYCRALKNDDNIFDYFIRDGFVKIVVKDGDKPILINHPDELKHMFGERHGG